MPYLLPPALAYQQKPAAHGAPGTACVTESNANTVPSPARPSERYEPPAQFISKGDCATPRVPKNAPWKIRLLPNNSVPFYPTKTTKTTQSNNNKTKQNLRFRAFLDCFTASMNCKGVLIHVEYTRDHTSFGVQVTARRPLRSRAAWTTSIVPYRGTDDQQARVSRGSLNSSHNLVAYLLPKCYLAH